MRIGILALALGLSACASEFSVHDKDEQEIVGFPVRTPVLVEITQRTSYEVVAGAEHAEFAKYCQPRLSSSHGILPLGDVHYVSFDAAALGKGEFSLDFYDSGALRKLSVNSDATEGLDSVSGLMEGVLPFVKAPKEADDARLFERLDDAETLRNKHCLQTGTTLVSIVRIAVD
jgi:hypothetical protein